MTGSDRLAEVHERLVAAVEAMASAADWQRFLDVARQFHTYSANNVWLILAQRPTATRVAGFQTWRKVGRQVRRGEKGIAILAPVVTRAAAVNADDEAQRPELVRLLRGFRVVHVFDVDQTDGEPLPEVDPPALLTGEAPVPLWEALAAQVGAAGFALSRGDCGGANGRTDFGDRTVRVRADVGPAQAAKTLAHELAHVLLHDGTEYLLGCRGRAEVEAESVAYLVCSTAGLTTDGYSFPYVTHWSAGDAEVVRATAERALGCARRILDGLEPSATRGAGEAA
ncbi:MAG: ImmA/IrrE family metallo-endopeptidase [Actinobacteria bacterium]|nr:ImmA/IrrE family metallo-endopeptidase [Actinomycetota bacterium]